MQAPKHASTATAMLKRGHTVSGTGTGEVLCNLQCGRPCAVATSVEIAYNCSRRHMSHRCFPHMSTIRLSFSFALEIGNTKGLSINVEGGMYKGELNQLEVESGYGMGMALPSSTRHAAGQGKVSA
jgi:hypothetical protein